MYNNKKLIPIITFGLIITLVGVICFNLGDSRRPISKRVYTNDNHSYEKALKMNGVAFSHDQMNKVYDQLKLERIEP